MGYRISKIEIKNFKFFKDIFSLNVDRKNVLLYGENGAGKSSIYWSVFTHFQAYSKSRGEAQKYFIAGHPQNLRNRYANLNDDSSINISFDDGMGGVTTIEDSNSHYYPDSADSLQFMRGTAMSSDFLNYKILSSLFDFRNSEENEVFPLFEKEVLPYIDLDELLVLIDGTETTTNNAGEWWGYIKRMYNEEGHIPLNQSRSSYDQRTPQYKAFQTLIHKFNVLLKAKLGLVLIRANYILKDTFGVNAEVVMGMDDAIFNKKIKKRKFDGQLHKPHVRLKAKMSSALLVDNSTIEHPRSFFNEAKITCMALALRLAILESHPNTPNFASVLLIDDLLISLDMPYRRTIIKHLLPYTQRFQTLIFTHDRAFFHLVKNEIDQMGEIENWKTFELYSEQNAEIANPKLFESKTHIEKSKAHLHQFEIPESVNELRKAAEEIFKNLLSTSDLMQIRMNSGFCNLNGMIQTFSSKYGKALGKENLFARLQNERKLLLNPFSHDDVETPFYRRELEQVIKDIEELQTIEKKVYVDYNDVRTKEYKMVVKKDAVEINTDILFLEQYVGFTTDGGEFKMKPKVFVRSSSTNKIQSKEWGLTMLFKEMCNRAGHNAATKPALEDCILDASGNKLF